MPALHPPPIGAPHTLGEPSEWVDRYGERLLRVALTRVADNATAEDLVQETLLSAWRSRDAFDGDCEPLTWLTAILRRRVADHYRRLQRRPAASGAASLDGRACERRGGDPETAEFWEVVTCCASELPDHLGRAFRMRTFVDESPAAICEAEGISRKNLSVRLHRARQLLRRCLEMRWFRGDVAPGDAR